MDVLKFGFRYWKKYLIPVIVIQLLSFLAIIADLFLPLISELFVDYIIMDSNAESNEGGVFAFLLNGSYGKPQTFELFYHIAFVFLLLFLTRIILIYIKNTSLQFFGLKLETKLRKITFHKLMELDSETISAYNSGELLTIVHSDTIMFKEMFCRVIPNIFDSIFVLITSIFLLSGINITFLILPLLLSPFLAVAVRQFMKQARKNYQKIRKSNSQMNLTVQENIEAVRLIRSFTNEDVEKKKFDVSNETVRNSYLNQINLSSKFEVIFSSIKQIAYIGTLGIGTILVLNGTMRVGFLVACSGYVLKIMDHITQINNALFQMQQQLVSGRSMMDFLNCEPKVKEKGTIVLQNPKPHIKVVNACVTMHGTKVLEGIDLDIPYGKKIGITGETGSGKSILLKSFARIFDLTKGSIMIDGKDLKEYTLESLHHCFSYVFQDVFLFSNTIDSNIAYADPNVKEELVTAAAEHAQAAEFIQRLPDGYQTIVGERGYGISGGQKQRVSIARAFLKDAPVLIFDDSTSALDRNTEKRLLETMKTVYPQKTVLISAHRLSSVIDCDEIIYLKDGKIAERGSFRELMELNGHFAGIYRLQQIQQQSVLEEEESGKEMI